jgi:hypothetical protein
LTTKPAAATVAASPPTRHSNPQKEVTGMIRVNFALAALAALGMALLHGGLLVGP